MGGFKKSISIYSSICKKKQTELTKFGISHKKQTMIDTTMARGVQE